MRNDNRLGYIYHCTTPFCHSCFKTQSPASSGKNMFLSVIFEPRPKSLEHLVVGLATASTERRSKGVGVSTAMGCFAVPLLERVTAGDATDTKESVRL